jgi:hypothetical protein
MNTPKRDNEDSVTTDCSTDLKQREALPDDGERLSDEWFRDRWPDEGDNCFGIECDSGMWFQVELYGENCFGWAVGGSVWDGDNFQTRGHVRDFLWYLQADFMP